MKMEHIAVTGKFYIDGKEVHDGSLVFWSDNDNELPLVEIMKNKLRELRIKKKTKQIVEASL